MNAGAPMWVRVGGGMESVPEHMRHGPADPDFPPPGGPWMPLNLGGRLVGWAGDGGLGLARRCAEIGQVMVEEHRDYLLGRLPHNLPPPVPSPPPPPPHAPLGPAPFPEPRYL